MSRTCWLCVMRATLHIDCQFVCLLNRPGGEWAHTCHNQHPSTKYSDKVHYRTIIIILLPRPPETQPHTSALGGARRAALQAGNAVYNYVNFNIESTQAVSPSSNRLALISGTKAVNTKV